jgi:hypothetical protein
MAWETDWRWRRWSGRGRAGGRRSDGATKPSTPQPAAEATEQARVLRVGGCSPASISGYGLGWQSDDLTGVGKGGGVRGRPGDGGGLAEVAVGGRGDKAALGAAGRGWRQGRRRQAGAPARKKKGTKCSGGCRRD